LSIFKIGGLIYDNIINAIIIYRLF
jgi:hypothetical protein